MSQIALHPVHPPQFGPSSRSLPSHHHCWYMLCNVCIVSSQHMAIQERRFWVTYVVIGLTIASLLNFSFLILSFLVLPWIHISSRLCASFAALLCVAPNTHCHIKVGLMTVLYSLFFSLTGTFLSQITPANPLHEFHADRILLSTSAPHPPVASIVEVYFLEVPREL